jgi:biopolymer transport protein ExbD
MAISSSGAGKSGSMVYDINVTPMADVMLVLLIIFMITTPLLQQGVFVNKAKAANAQEAPEVEGEDATTVTITRDGAIYVNKLAVPDDVLLEKLETQVALAPEKPLFIKSDVATPYGRVVEVINKGRETGVERIGLLVDRVTKEGGL